MERQLEYSLDKQIKNYTLLGINEPFYYYVNLVGVMGVTGWDRGRHYGLPPQEIDDDFLQLSDVIVESRDYESYKKVYEQAVSSLWNAYGFTEEPSDYK
ncbi:hypothetical protein [Paenibacillus massiliensis]|uniref:hypothetical protein n=1 Tax=Paenibacillus massiliensis TaxID=225917 RepID=UPI00048DB40B|nr:hypothetical protein [Paenibacillus massiliensis]